MKYAHTISCQERFPLDAGRLSSAFLPLSHQGCTASSIRCTVAHAQGRRRPADDEVDLDDEEYFDEDQASLAALRRSSIPSPFTSCLVTGIPHGPLLNYSRRRECCTVCGSVLQGFGVTTVLKQAGGMVGNLTERLADVAYDYVPESVSRSTVSHMAPHTQ